MVSYSYIALQWRQKHRLRWFFCVNQPCCRASFCFASVDKIRHHCVVFPSHTPFTNAIFLSYLNFNHSCRIQIKLVVDKCRTQTPVKYHQRFSCANPARVLFHRHFHRELQIGERKRKRYRATMFDQRFHTWFSSETTYGS